MGILLFSAMKFIEAMYLSYNYISVRLSSTIKIDIKDI